MNRTGPRPAGLGRPLLALLVLLSATLLFAGCAQNRSAATQSWSGLAVTDDSLFVGTNEGKLIQLSADAGIARIAPYMVPDPAEGEGFPALYGTPTVENGRVFAGAYNGVVVSVSAADLGDARTFEIEGNDLAKGIAGSVLPSGELLVVAAAEDADKGRLYVLESGSLIENCRYPARNEEPIGQIWSTPVLHNGIAYFGDLSHEVHAVSISDCRPVWDRPAELGGAIVAPPTIAGSNLYVGAFDQIFYAVNLATGGVTELFGAENWFWSGSVTDGDRVYVPNMDGNVYAFDIRDGRVAWAYPNDGTGEPILSTPVLVGSQLVYASDSGVMVVLRARDGVRQWDRRVGNDVRAPLSTDGVRVFLHSLDETVSAVDLETKQLAWERNLDDVK